MSRTPGTASEAERQALEVGDETVVVITEPNENKDRDPVTQIDGTTVFVRFQDRTPEFGEAVRVRIADIGTSHMVAVAVDADSTTPTDEGGEGTDE